MPGRAIGNPLAEAIARSIVEGDAAPPPPVGGFVWDSTNASSTNAPTLDVTEKIATFTALPAGQIGAIKIKPSGFLPDTGSRLIAFRYLAATGAQLFASIGTSNSSFDVDNLFGTIFGNSFLSAQAPEDPDAGGTTLGKNSVGGFVPFSPASNIGNGDIMMLHINGADWRWYRNGVRVENIRANPDGGDFDISFDEIFTGVLNQDSVAGDVSVEIIDLSSVINAAGYSSQWIPAGAKDLNGNVLGQAGNKMIWNAPLDSQSILKSRLSENQKTCDFQLASLANIMQGGTTVYDKADYSGWVVQEFEITAVSGLNTDYQFALQMNQVRQEGVDYFNIDYQHNNGAPTLLSASGSGTGWASPAINPTLAVGDLFGYAFNVDTNAAEVYYKPFGGGEVTLNTGNTTISDQFAFTMQIIKNLATGNPALTLRQKQGGDYGITLYPVGSKTLFNETP